jgi:hypothetical protein
MKGLSPIYKSLISNDRAHSCISENIDQNIVVVGLCSTLVRCANLTIAEAPNAFSWRKQESRPPIWAAQAYDFYAHGAFG